MLEESDVRFAVRESDLPSSLVGVAAADDVPLGLLMLPSSRILVEFSVTCVKTMRILQTYYDSNTQY